MRLSSLFGFFIAFAKLLLSTKLWLISVVFAVIKRRIQQFA